MTNPYRAGATATAFLLLLAASVIFSSNSVSAAETKKPNIVFMMADNLGYGDLGVYGGGETRGMPTPRIDRLASEGVRFTQFLVEPGCTPSRAAFLTGRYSIRSGLSLVIVPGTPNTLADKEITLAEMLKDAGYDTAMYGKWHLGTDEQSLPHNQGFDEFYGILNTTDEALYVPTMQMAKAPMLPESAVPQIHRAVRGGKLEPVKPYNFRTRRTIDVEITDLSVNYIKKHAQTGKPFFLFIPWTRPHYPNLTSEAFKRKSRIGLYGDSVMEMDHNTGRVLDAIQEAGIKDNTIVIFISDNGPMRETVWPDAGFAGPFRGELGDPWEGSIRTVGMVKWPGKITPRVSNEMFSIMDFYPTLARIAGTKVPTDRPIDGVDQGDFLFGRQDTSNRESLLTFTGDQLQAVRWRQFRVYFTDVVPVGSGPSRRGGLSSASVPLNGYPLIYNIERDPREEHNMSTTHGWVAAYFIREVMKYKRSLKEHPNPPAPNLTKW